jgi:hypothetical protein
MGMNGLKICIAHIGAWSIALSMTVRAGVRAMHDHFRVLPDHLADVLAQ